MFPVCLHYTMCLPPSPSLPSLSSPSALCKKESRLGFEVDCLKDSKSLLATLSGCACKPPLWCESLVSPPPPGNIWREGDSFCGCGGYFLFRVICIHLLVEEEVSPFSSPISYQFRNTNCLYTGISCPISHSHSCFLQGSYAWSHILKRAHQPRRGAALRLCLPPLHQTQAQAVSAQDQEHHL